MVEIRLIKSDGINNDRFVHGSVIVDDNKYMITEKLNDLLLNTYDYEVLKYPF